VRQGFLVRGLCAIALVASLGVGCRARVQQAAPRKQALGRVEVAFSGCAEVRGGSCALDESRRLRIWVADAKASLQAWTELGSLAVEASAVEAGQAFDVVVPAGAQLLGVGTGEWQWFGLQVKPFIRDAEVDAASARLQAEPVGAAKRLQAELPSLQGDRRARITSLLGRAAMQTGDYAAAKRLLTESAALFKASGQTSRWLQDVLAVAFVSNARLGAFAETLRLLQECEAGLADAPWLRAEHSYQQGLVHSGTGNIRGALAAFRKAKSWSLRLSNDGVLLATQQWMAMTLLAIGRGDEALEIEEGLVGKVTRAKDCIRGPVYATASWIAMGQTPMDVDKTQLWIDEASRALGACKDPFRTRNAELNEVTFAIKKQDYESAHEHLITLESEPSGQTTQFAILEKGMSGRLKFAQGNAKAAAVIFDQALRLSSASGYVDDEIRMKVAKGTALLRSNNAALAIALFEDAETQLDQRLLFVPLGEGRTRFLAAREEGAQGLVSAHLALGNRKAAFVAARRARSRALQTAILGERVGHLSAEQHGEWLRALAEFSALRAQLELASAEDWHLSQVELNAALTQRHPLREHAQAKLDEAFSLLSETAAKPWLAPPPSQGELLLLYVQRRSSNAQNSLVQWDAFAASRTTVKHAVVDTVEPNGSANTTHPWLLPFSKAIEAATEIRVLFTNNFSEEVHSFAFKGYPLLKHAPVVYALDVPAAHTAEGRPLIVSNAQGDLPQSAEEGRQLETALKSRAPKLLEGSDADRKSVLDLLPTTGWFHYAGHAVFQGAEGLDSGLPLAQGSKLSAADVLSLSAAPALVVLSACEAGRSSGDSNTAGLGLAQAFVLAGSKAVLAPNRPVDDGFSRQLMELVYQQLLSGLPVQRALQVAQLDPKVQQVSGWSAFRLLVP